MKKWIAICLALVMAMALVACGGGTSSSSSSSASTGSSSADSSSADSSSSESTPADSSSADSASEEDGIAMTGGDVSAHTVEAIKAKGTLVVTTEAGYAPFEFLDENDNVIGLDASLAQALADDLGVTLDMQNIAFDSVVPEVQAGNADMAIAGLTPNKDRKKSVDMSDMYYEGGQCMLVRAEDVDTYATKESLSGQVMATQKAALQETLMAEQFPDATPLLLPDFPQCVQNLKNGDCVAVMIDAISAEQYMQTVEGLAVGKVPVEIDPEEGGNAVAVMKGNTDLLDWVNERIAAYKAEGKLEQWFQEAQEKAESMGIE